MSEMGLEGIGDLALHIIFSKLGPKDTLIVSSLNKTLKLSASDDSLWSKFCHQHIGISSPLDPLGNPLPSFKVAYQLWREAFGMYPWSLVCRVKRCYDGLKNWVSTNFPEAEATLEKGASEADIQNLEGVLKVKLPLATRILYRFFDGQDLLWKGYPTSLLGRSLGLIGGYSFYDHAVNVFLLPLREIIVETKEIARHLGFSSFSSRTEYIVVAASSSYSEKIFFLNCTNGQLYVGCRNLRMDGEMIPCVPSSLIKSVHDFNSEQQQDAMLLWLEEHARRLQNGIIKLRQDGNIRSICQYPEEPPLCSTALTNGVKVRASSAFVPELADLKDNAEKYWFSYSIRMSLLPEGCIINGLHFSSCQLERRHWLIRANGAVVSDVNAEAVIGKYPLLHPGEKEFVYESCTPLPTPSGSVEGSFTFVPGRLSKPKGQSFEVEVAQFPLQVPEYIF